MATDSVKRFLANVAKQTVRIETDHHFEIARNITFSFANLNVCYDNFNLRGDEQICPNKNDKIDRLINTFELLAQRSVGPITTDANHCHVVDAKKLRSCGMGSLTEYFHDEIFYQMGSNYEQHTERIIGFFNKQSNVFNVCLIDLHHRVYPMN